VERERIASRRGEEIRWATSHACQFVSYTPCPLIRRLTATVGQATPNCASSPYQTRVPQQNRPCSQAGKEPRLLGGPGGDGLTQQA
jgi:hypothetical protein